MTIILTRVSQYRTTSACTYVYRNQNTKSHPRTSLRALLSSIDDPVTWGVLPFRYHLNPSNHRWSLGSYDIVFKNKCAILPLSKHHRTRLTDLKLQSNVHILHTRSSTPHAPPPPRPARRPLPAHPPRSRPPALPTPLLPYKLRPTSQPVVQIPRYLRSFLVTQ